MLELHLVGTAANGDLLLAPAEGGAPRYRLATSAALREASVERVPPTRQLVPRRQLGPAQVQARLRTGVAASELARETGLDLAWVERLAEPVRAEMGEMLRGALASPVTGEKTTSARSLAELLQSGLPIGVNDDDVEWVTTKRRDGTWRIAVRVHLGRRVMTATWVWAPRTRTLVPASARARSISFPGR